MIQLDKKTNETFGITLQALICSEYGILHNINSNRINESLIKEFKSKEIIKEIFGEIQSEPVKYLTNSKEFTDDNQRKVSPRATCPHNFLLSNGKTFSVRTNFAKNKKFCPKVVGQSGLAVLNYFFGHLTDYEIDRSSFKEFCINNVNEIIPILLDYALISDYTSYVYIDKQEFKKVLIERGDIPNITFLKEDFTFSKNLSNWIESNQVYLDNNPIAEFQLHKNRFYKFRLTRDFLFSLIDNSLNIKSYDESIDDLNNSTIGDSAELAISKVFNIKDGINDPRLISNSSQIVTNILKSHYSQKRDSLFEYLPISYQGTMRRERGGLSKSGIDFRLESNRTLSVKTNKNRSKKVCPSEIGQPNPSTFDIYFKDKDLYDGEMNFNKFKELIMDRNKVVILLKSYIEYLNECDYILWTIFKTKDKSAQSINISKDKLSNLNFLPEKISYTQDIRISVARTPGTTLKYNNQSLGEFQIHISRNVLMWRFNMDTLLSLV